MSKEGFARLRDGWKRRVAFAQRSALIFSITGGVVFSVSVPIAPAEDSAPEVLDAALLRAGAIVAADLESVSADKSRADVAEIKLSNLRVVASRLAEAPSRLRLRSKLEVRGNALSAKRRGGGTFARGDRYIMLLRADLSEDGPFERGPESLYKVDPETGYVRCGSGFVLGTDPTGVICANVDTNVIEPLHEAEFLERLESEYKKALKRRPALAAKFGAGADQPSGSSTGEVR